METYVFLILKCCYIELKPWMRCNCYVLCFIEAPYKKWYDCEAMNANPLACGDHFKTYIYMKPSHAYLDHIQLLSIIPQQNWKKILNIKF